MRRLAPLTVALLLLAPAVAAFGASFTVQDRTLQSVIVDAHITTPKPPVAESYSIDIVVRVYNSGNGSELGPGQSPRPIRTESVPAGRSYKISWTTNGTAVSCASSDLKHVGDPPELADAGEFRPDRSATHTLCVKSGGNPTVEVTFELVPSPTQAAASSSEPERCADDMDGHDECGSVDDASSNGPGTATPELDDDGSPEATPSAAVDSDTSIAEVKTLYPVDQEERE
jgi:hypothetical protein